MTEIIFAIIIIALLAEIYLVNRSLQDERKDWTKAIMAKDLTDLTQNALMEKKPVNDTPNMPEFTALNAEDDELFDKHIQAEINAGKKEFEQEELTH